MKSKLLFTFILLMTSKEVIKRLKKDGWYLVNQVGSHKQFKHDEIKGKVTVSDHKGDIAIGTLRNIYRQAGWNLNS